ncbi:DUF3040 domain-containing protein [Actinophytocola sp. NPDC049390]|uniref:DUF3040 domain-containing protein n=1 Tax=Actinophytocola sp. NPDC049390 TaxID=3363894 RepID=UPI00378B5C3C
MLSEHEQATLREIQRHLTVDDPDLEKSFRDFAATPPSARYLWVYTTLVVVSAVLATAMLLVGAFGGAVAFAVIACALWWTRHLERAEGRSGG